MARLLLVSLSLMITLHMSLSMNETIMNILAFKGIPAKKFSSILRSEVDNELFSSGQTWENLSKMEWNRAIQSEKVPFAIISRNQEIKMFPFIVCSSEAGQTGFERWYTLKGLVKEMVKGNVLTDIFDRDQTVFLYNKEDMSCVLVRLPASVASSLALVDDTSVSVQPMLSIGKLKFGSFEHMSHRIENLITNEVSTTSFPRINILLCSGSIPETDNSDELISSRIVKLFMNNDSSAPVFRSLSKDMDNMGKVVPSEIFRLLKAGTSEELKKCNAIIGKLILTLNKDLRILSVTVPDDVSIDISSTSAKVCGSWLLMALSLLDDVCSIEVEPEMKALNTNAQWMVQSGIKDERPWFDEGITGKGQVVSVSDTGIDLDNCYFWDATGEVGKGFFKSDITRRKVVQYVPYTDGFDSLYGHGTHVCGTVAGHRAEDGNTESTGMADGIAKDAKLAIFDIGNTGGEIVLPLVTAAYLTTGRSSGSRLHSASWGSDSNSYGIYANAFDRYLYAHDDFLTIVAAGNSGDGNTFNTVGDPATAKNVIAVGASHSSGRDLSSGQLGESYIADFSSRGPTSDGRTKPDILAPGSSILSAGGKPATVGECDPVTYPKPGKADEGVVSKEGTSMAAPVVSGTAALIRQYFVDGFYPTGKKNESNSFDPSGMLVKAVILNGGQYMRGVDNGNGRVLPVSPYDNNQNFGRISLIDSLYLYGKSNVQTRVFDRETIAQKGKKTMSFTVDKSNGCDTSELTATLTWFDQAGFPGCQKCLIDDLDLYITKGNTTYYPNGLNKRDTLHSTERVRISSSDGETVSVTVEATNIVVRTRQYALVVSGCFGGVASELDTSKSAFLNDDSYNDSTSKKLAWAIAGVVGALAVAIISFFAKQYWKRTQLNSQEEEQVDDTPLLL